MQKHKAKYTHHTRILLFLAIFFFYCVLCFCCQSLFSIIIICFSLPFCSFIIPWQTVCFTFVFFFAFIFQLVLCFSNEYFLSKQNKPRCLISQACTLYIVHITMFHFIKFRFFGFCFRFVALLHFQWMDDVYEWIETCSDHWPSRG